MSQRQQIEVDVGGTVVLYPPNGRPASATIEALKGDSEFIAETSITLDTVDTTIVADSSIGSAKLQLVSGFSDVVIGRKYWLSSANDGNGFEVVVADKNSPDIVVLDEPLLIQYLAGSKFQGHGLRHSIAADVADATHRRIRLLWRYVDPFGDSRLGFQLLDIVNNPWHLNIGLSDLRNIDSRFAGYVSGESGWQRYITQAESELWLALTSHDIEPDLLDDREALKVAGAYKILELFYMREQELSEAYRKRYSESLAMVFTSDKIRVRYDDDISDSQDPDGIGPRYLGIS